MNSSVVGSPFIDAVALAACSQSPMLSSAVSTALSRDPEKSSQTPRLSDPKTFFLTKARCKSAQAKARRLQPPAVCRRNPLGRAFGVLIKTLLQQALTKLRSKKELPSTSQSRLQFIRNTLICRNLQKIPDLKLDISIYKRLCRSSFLLFAFCHLLSGHSDSLAQSPQTVFWIWHPNTNTPTAYFRKNFRTPPQTWNARLTITADDQATVFLNGVSVARCTDWRNPSRGEVSVRLNQGENVIAVRAENRSGPAGLLVQLNVGGQTNIVSDTTWLVSTNEEPGWSTLNFSAAHWTHAASLGEHGIQPWGDVLFRASATPAESLKVPDGFRVELLRSAEPNEGSWICMTFDDRGRIIISPQGDQRPLLRMTLGVSSHPVGTRSTASQTLSPLPQGGEGQGEGAPPNQPGRQASQTITKIEPIAPGIHYAMGLLYAFGSLYVNGHGANGTGLYRLIDENKNDQYETNEIHFLKKFDGESEHGYHGLALGPDKHIYIINGNGTKLPQGISTNSPYRNYAEDALSGSIGDSDDQDGSKAPNCHVLQTDAEGREWKLWCGGMRNAYAIDFNEDGELFTFDSDMEWDWGTPWYKPTRILHLVSGGEYGWRDGTRMWADWYPDCLPPTCYIGIGSPTGIKFGTKSNFPEKYRRALFVADWSYGRILAVHLTPKGASYTGQWENFVQGTPLNLTALAFGPDGAMYITTGGRGTQSGLYRVTFVQPFSAVRQQDRVEDEAARYARGIRHKLEEWQARRDPEAVRFILGAHSPILSGAAIKSAAHYSSPYRLIEDRWIRFATRVALEAQSLDLWRPLGTNDSLLDVRSLALARVKPEELASDLLLYPRRPLVLYGTTPLLRLIELYLLRNPSPPQSIFSELIEDLSRRYPTKPIFDVLMRGDEVNPELARILLHLQAGGAVSKTIFFLQRPVFARFQEDQMFYIEQLRNVREGWTLEDRRIFFEWFLKPRDPKAHPPEILQYFKDVGRSYVDGAYFDRYLRDFRRQAIATLTPEERKALAPLLERPITRAQNIPANNRSFVKNWKLEDLLPELNKPSKPDLARGRQAFVDAQCLTCHRFGNDGGIAGPELNGVGSKYTSRDILESIIEPSKVINEQYQNHTAILKDGDTISGRLVNQSDTEVILETDRLNGATEKIPRANVTELKPSALSPMPEGLADILTKDEILDLIAYLTR
jgi:putative heme-binding domain-containing protein